MMIKDFHIFVFPQYLYLFRKLKHPTGSKFIIIAPKCSVNSQSKSLISVLRLLSKQTKAYNYTVTINKRVFSIFSSGRKTFWAVLNNPPMIDAIKKQFKEKDTFNFYPRLFNSSQPYKQTNLNLCCGNQSTSVLREIQGIYCCYEVQR